MSFSQLLLPLFLLAVVVVLLPSGTDALGTVQSVAVRGLLQCKGKPMNATKVKLYEQDTLDPDDLMDEGLTDEDGHFVLRGTESEIGDIEPKLNIYHHCNEEDSANPLKKLCYKKISIRIPSDYITKGEVPIRTFDAGTLNLAGEFGGESRDCLN